jgi:flagellar biosynthesis protein FliP
LLAPTMVCIPLVLLAFVILRDGKWLRARPGY